MSSRTNHLFTPLRLVERNALAWRRSWWVIASGIADPIFYLLGLGFGMGALVGDIEIDGTIIEYATYVAPGLMASAAMNGAIFDTTFNFYFKLKKERAYDAVLNTPVSLTDIVIGELGWSIARGCLYAVFFLIVMVVLGLTASWWVLLTIPASLLVAAAFAGIGIVATTYIKKWSDFDYIQLALVPLFLASTTFFPLSVYPAWAQPIVNLTPLYHGVNLLRDLNLGTVGWNDLGHVGYLAVVATVCTRWASRRLGPMLLS